MTDFERRVLERLRAARRIEGFYAGGYAGIVLEADSDDVWVVIDTVCGGSFAGPLGERAAVPFDPSDEFIEALRDLVNERGEWSDESLFYEEGPWEEYVNTGKWMV